MAEIENVSGTSARLIENRARAGADFGNVGEQRDRIEIALHRDAVVQPRPRVGEIDAPIEAQHVPARLAHQLEQIAGHGPEVDNGHVGGNRRDHRRRVRQHEASIVVGAEAADPTVENLHDVGARTDLHLQVISGDAREQLHQAMPRFGLRVHESFGRLVLPRRSAFDQIRRERERRAGKSDQRSLRAERAMNQLDRIADETERGHVDLGYPLEVGFGANRAIDYRAVAFLEMQSDFHRDQRQQDVRENYRRIHLEPLDRRDGNFSRQLGPLAHLEKLMLLANAPILRHVAPRLAHQPDRSVTRSLAAARFHHRMIGQRRARRVRNHRASRI